MIKRILIILLLICCALFIPGCAEPQQSEKEVSFSRMVQIQNMNSYLKLSTIEGLDSDVFGRNLVITNISDDYISLPKDYGIRIFTYDDKLREWKEIKNKMQYLGVNNFILLPSDKRNDLSREIGGYIPDLEISPKPTSIRVTVIGNIFDNNNNTITDKKIGAYVDLELNNDNSPKAWNIYLNSNNSWLPHYLSSLSGPQAANLHQPGAQPESRAATAESRA